MIEMSDSRSLGSVRETQTGTSLQLVAWHREILSQLSFCSPASLSSLFMMGFIPSPSDGILQQDTQAGTRTQAHA